MLRRVLGDARGGELLKPFLGGRFKNGNIHVIFHKHALHLVDRLNARIAEPLPKALPAPR